MRTIWVGVLVAAAACSKGGGDAEGRAGADDGQERGDCYGNGTCDPGLVCYSDLCVRPPPADCAKVAEKLSGYRLDNYAPRDERRRVIDELTRLCRDAHLTEEEGRCILGAQGRAAIASCPRPLLPELTGDPSGCVVFAKHFAELVLAKLAADGADPARLTGHRGELTGALDTSCRDDGWTDAARACVLDASSMDAAERACESALPDELQRKIRDRIGPLIDRLERDTRP